MIFSLLYEYDLDPDSFLANAAKVESFQAVLDKDELLGGDLRRSIDLFARKHIADYRDYLRKTHNFDGYRFKQCFELVVPYDRKRNVKGFKEDFELVEIAEDSQGNFQITFHFKTPRNVEHTTREMRFIKDALAQNYDNPITAPRLIGNLPRFSDETYYSAQLYVLKDEGALS